MSELYIQIDDKEYELAAKSFTPGARSRWGEEAGDPEVELSEIVIAYQLDDTRGHYKQYCGEAIKDYITLDTFIREYMIFHDVCSVSEALFDLEEKMCDVIASRRAESSFIGKGYAEE